MGRDHRATVVVGSHPPHSCDPRLRDGVRCDVDGARFRYRPEPGDELLDDERLGRQVVELTP